MNVIGFNFTKISAERSISSKIKLSTDTNIHFTEVVKETLPFLKDTEAVRLNFSFSIIYNSTEEKKPEKHGQILFEGSLILSSSKEETKELLKSWKKKEIPSHMHLGLLNFILQKCSVKALALEEELALPSHVPLPNIQPKPNNSP